MRRRPEIAVPVVVALHVLGWGALLGVVAPEHVAITDGLGATAYALGLRHAFDADHIATIDATTRRLLAEGRPARSVGLWFSLGHSTIVTVLCVLLALGVRTIGAGLADDGSALHRWTGAIGPIVSGVFLVGMAVLNAIGLVRRRRGVHHGHTHDLGGGGPVSRVLRRVGAVIDRPSRMYVVGVLFGLGFDTATEVGLLALAGTASLGSVPWWAVLTLPVLFAAGMSLLDSVQGAMARRAYMWGAAGAGTGVPAARYDLLVTGVSIVAATVIAVVELSGVAASWLPRAAAWLAPVGSVDLGTVGFALTGVLLAAWVVGLTTMRPVRR